MLPFLDLFSRRSMGIKTARFYARFYHHVHVPGNHQKSSGSKFNETKDWNCKEIDSLYDKIEDRQEANDIINSLKICDPAVGSGHFLVSALNEIISIKNDLKILQDRDGKRLKEYVFEVVNDELIVTDEEGELFEYNPNSKESQRIQEALFHEKQTIIENCLLGWISTQIRLKSVGCAFGSNCLKMPITKMKVNWKPFQISTLTLNAAIRSSVGLNWMLTLKGFKKQ